LNKYYIRGKLVTPREFDDSMREAGDKKVFVEDDPGDSDVPWYVGTMFVGVFLLILVGIALSVGYK
jgi:hypothetical protein